MQKHKRVASVPTELFYSSPGETLTFSLLPLNGIYCFYASGFPISSNQTANQKMAFRFPSG